MTADDEVRALRARLDQMTPVVIGTQADIEFFGSLLTEIVRDLAKRSAEPNRYIADLSDRVMARADAAPLAQQRHPVDAEARAVADRFFERAGRPFRG